MSKIFPAATAVLVRDSSDGLEVLLLRKSKKLSFAEGSWVFPGGRIDKADYLHDLEDIEAAARRGAVRETMEESQLSVDAQALLYFSHWTTPPEHTKRFATWFFIGEVEGDSHAVEVDGGEIVEHRWCQPAAALADQQAKKITMMPPTFVTLTELERCNTVAEALSMYRNRPVPEFMPKVTMTDNGIAMLYPGDAGYDQADQDIPGPRHRMWMLDEAWRYEKTHSDE
ncbi:NUDIX hydrolase [Oceanicoccus sp. KOV_DT_Chl]|uniref:NUDIX hydrolase n=1 Tax=Oceanicoccus sp. KOV_DT_Chl TaxID=1904639 RepID=UPI000C7D03B6|nr:NUDIX hydrolase [Oceanicoccus sp. KOV_DT_Chl]